MPRNVKDSIQTFLKEQQRKVTERDPERDDSDVEAERWVRSETTAPSHKSLLRSRAAAASRERLNPGERIASRQEVLQNVFEDEEVESAEMSAQEDSEPDSLDLEQDDLQDFEESKEEPMALLKEVERDLMQVENDEEKERSIVILKQRKNDEVNKGKAILDQKFVWERVMDLRIHTQKIIQNVNKLPGFEDLQSMSNDETQKLENCQKEIQAILSLCGGMPSFPHKVSLEDLDSLQEHSNQVFDQICNDIDFWTSKTQLSFGKFRKTMSNLQVFNQSSHVQISSAIKNDKDRLVKRSRTPSSQVSVIAEKKRRRDDGTVDYYFDDMDFYQKMLKDLIESGRCHGKIRTSLWFDLFV